ncbi:hypothetical protein KC19_3G027000 [Ceratodon purpureus]|uniref:UTP--glucose-1-phosphate uridylyltransferase n=1 Tax=Ceratodon purpureus TaxID=3225 RepID=A0A8T0IE70_CERPU|nr:hypothetical protein KC19_3G027000 [Ceratodon purpureus]
MSGVTGMESMSVAPRLSRAVQKLERWALHQQSKSDEPIAWDKINPRTDLKVLPYDKLPSVVDDHEKCKVLLHKLIVVKLCGTLGRSLGTTQPKSLVEIHSEQSFVDLAVQQIEVLNVKYNAKVLLVLATSDNTDRAVKQAVKKYSASDVDIIVFNQTEYPREVWPVTPKLGEDGGYLTNNGDLFAAFSFSGKLDELLALGKEYLFISNCDNLGATVDLNMLNNLSENQCDYCMEVTPKNGTDAENGAYVSSEGNIELLEFEEVSRSQNEKSRSGDVKVVNTNSTWVNLKAVKRLAEIEALDIYCSSKGAGEGENITFQLQTSSGAPLYSLQVNGEIFENLPIEGNSDLLLVQFFDGSVAVEVPRTRFHPIRDTSDLLLFRSDLYTVREGVVCPNPLRLSDVNPTIELEGLKLRKMQYFTERLKHIPSLLELSSLRVIGDVWFGSDVILQGKVVIWAKKDERIDIPDGEIIKDQLVTAGLEYTDLDTVDIETESSQWCQERESDPDTFEEEDFPACPPEWSDLDIETYSKRKQEVIGKPIWVQDVADEDLKELGYDSWKSYVVDSCISNW